MTRARTRTLTLGIAGGVLAGVLVACGGGGDGEGNGDREGTSPPPARGGDTTATRVDVDMKDFTLELSEDTFGAGEYTFIATNSGSHDHALELEGPGGEEKTRTLEPGESANLEVTLRDGTYRVYCPVDGHAEQGMETRITVGGGGPADESPPSDSGY
jgi:plastocyanin